MRNHVLGGNATDQSEVILSPRAPNAALTAEQLTTLAHMQAKSINRMSAQLREVHQLLVEQAVVIKEQAAAIDRLERGV